MPTEVICALIAGVVTLITSMGTWHFTIKKDREKQKEDLKNTLLEYYNKNRAEIDAIKQNDLQEIRDDISDLGANIQQKIAILEVQLQHTNEDINTLSTRVDKHNNVIERTYKNEQAILDIREAIKEFRHA